MSRYPLVLACILGVTALLGHVQQVRAHEEIAIGDYTVEIGWLHEPPVAGQENAIVLHVVNERAGLPVQDISGLTLTIAYGGQEKALALQPLERPGEFSAPIVPTAAGQYTVFLGGTLGDTPVDAHMDPEEVEFANGARSATDPALQFPPGTPLTQNAESDPWNWVLYVGIGVCLLLLLFSPFPILRPRR